ncbi:hypothetical protein TrRE_jg771 [Triparma retinervis]|uniref:Pre-mRNA-splicing factor 38 n=1 Tax=Triparma retinervis TaxID=2557542 RepID=A0A9W7A352_9STRA|nr:hypothetical protein TrRE_jg771 [Triparma retinervis]
MAPGVNTTDPLALSVHGLNPQSLIETITRNKCYGCRYWKEECFGLDAEGVMSKGASLKYIGSTLGPAFAPTPFICLVLKLLQISPDVKIIKEYIKQQDFKYLRLLGAFYMRLVGSPVDIWECLESVVSDYRKFVIRVPGKVGEEQWRVEYVDDFVYGLLHDVEGYVLGIQLPRLPGRKVMEGGVSWRKKAQKGGDVRRVSKLRGDKRVKEIAKHKRRMERIELGLEGGGGKKKKGLFKEKEEDGGEGKGEGKGEGEKKNKEGTVDFWNEERRKLGLKELKG